MAHLYGQSGGKQKDYTVLTNHQGSYDYTAGSNTVKDLGSLKTIVGGYCGGMLFSAKIEGSTNNVDWTQLAYTGNANGVRYASFDGGTVQYRYIRFTWTSDNSHNITVYAGMVYGY